MIREQIAQLQDHGALGRLREKHVVKYGKRSKKDIISESEMSKEDWKSMQEKLARVLARRGE